MSTYIVAVTGASGAPYALRLLGALAGAGHQIKLVVTQAGEKVVAIECGLHLRGSSRHKESQWKEALGLAEEENNIQLLLPSNLAASIASGSFRTAGMAVVPCSMGTLARIATGASLNLVERAADVTLKERRPLVLVPRETPLNQIHLRNMLTAQQAGADIVPAMPAFYHRPQTVQDLVDALVGRVLDRLGVESALLRRWAEPPAEQALLEAE